MVEFDIKPCVKYVAKTAYITHHTQHTWNVNKDGLLSLNVNSV